MISKLNNLLLLCALLPSLAIGDNDGTLPYVVVQHVDDFSRLGEMARADRKIILLEIAATDCGYCELLEEEFLKPMLRNPDYRPWVLIRKINTDEPGLITDFSGRRITAEAFARQYRARLTPTLLFLDSDGREVSERIIGINSLDLFGGYLDEALADGVHRIRGLRAP